MLRIPDIVEFLKKLQEECDNAFNPFAFPVCNGRCRAAAWGYYLAVKQAGGDAYRAAQERERARSERSPVGWLSAILNIMMGEEQ